MEFIKIEDISKSTEEQIIAAIECNARTYRLMSSQVEALKKASAQALQKAQIVKEEKPQDIIVGDTESEPSIDQEFEEEALFFYSEVKDLTKEDLSESLEDVLPPRKHYNYERILRRVQAELLRDCKETRDFIATEQLDKEEIAELKEDISLILAKISAISKALVATDEDVNKTQPKDNTIIFVPTSGGNIRVLDDMAKMPSSYYKKFEALFASIKEGTFKGVKKMHGVLDGLSEVRDIPTGARVTFMRLDRNTYAIISAFVKKTDNNSGYQRMVENHYQNYKQQEQGLKANISNPEFMTLHSQYEIELFDMISPTPDTKAPLRRKEVQ